MKRLIVLLTIATLSLPCLAKDDRKGKVIDGSLVVRLEGEDLTRNAFFSPYSDFGSHTIMQTNLLDTQKVKLSIRYSFNTVQSKYRGSGAGADSKARM